MARESKRKFNGEDIYLIAGYFFLAAVPARFILEWDVTKSILVGAGTSFAMLLLRLFAQTAPSCSIFHQSRMKADDADNRADDGDSEEKEPENLRERISLYSWVVIVWVVLCALYAFSPLAIFTVVSLIAGSLKVGAIALSLALYSAFDLLLFAIYRSFQSFRR